MTSLFDLYIQGGGVMHLILICSLVALYIVVDRFMAIRRARTMPQDFVNELRNFIRKGDIASAQLFASRYDVPVGRIVKAGLAKLHRGHARVQQAMEEQGGSEALMLERGMGLLATIAGVAPLLGFLGTVIGIALAFRDISVAGGQVSPDKLADGIQIALYTTVFGLVVGIPVFAFYNYLNGLTQQAVGRLEIIAREIFDVVEEELPGGGARMMEQ